MSAHARNVQEGVAPPQHHFIRPDRGSHNSESRPKKLVIGAVTELFEGLLKSLKPLLTHESGETLAPLGSDDGPCGELNQRRHFATCSGEIAQEFLTAYLLSVERNRGSCLKLRQSRRGRHQITG